MSSRGSTHGGQRRRPHGRLHRRDAQLDPLPGARLPGRLGRSGLSRRRLGGRGRLHVRRLRQDRRRPRGALRRRDLGRDAVGPAHRDRLDERRAADHAGHAAVAAGAVLPRRAQRDPGRGPCRPAAPTRRRSGPCSRLRGMGYYATTTGSADDAPVEDFSPPPDLNGPRGTIAGRVTGVRGHAGGRRDGWRSARLVAIADTDGRYSLTGVPAHATRTWSSAHPDTTACWPR